MLGRDKVIDQDILDAINILSVAHDNATDVKTLKRSINDALWLLECMIRKPHPLAVRQRAVSLRRTEEGKHSVEEADTDLFPEAYWRTVDYRTVGYFLGPRKIK